MTIWIVRADDMRERRSLITEAKDLKELKYYKIKKYFRIETGFFKWGF